MSESGHFETKSDACHRAPIGLILLQQLTFWRSASKVGAEGSCGFSTPRRAVVVQFGALTSLEMIRLKMGAAVAHRHLDRRTASASKLSRYAVK
jgi:hypothetical protein